MASMWLPKKTREKNAHPNELMPQYPLLRGHSVVFRATLVLCSAAVVFEGLREATSSRLAMEIGGVDPFSDEFELCGSSVMAAALLLVCGGGTLVFHFVNCGFGHSLLGCVQGSHERRLRFWAWVSGASGAAYAGRMLWCIGIRSVVVQFSVPLAALLASSALHRVASDGIKSTSTSKPLKDPAKAAPSQAGMPQSWIWVARTQLVAHCVWLVSAALVISFLSPESVWMSCERDGRCGVCAPWGLCSSVRVPSGS